jgi:hypothetical protein
VFISTPHRGSYKASALVANLIRRLVSVPQKVARHGTDLMKLTESSNLPKELRGKRLTAIDGMSPKKPVALKLADLPVAPGIKAHSIIAVQTSGDYHKGERRRREVHQRARGLRGVGVDRALVPFLPDKPETIEEVGVFAGSTSRNRHEPGGRAQVGCLKCLPKCHCKQTRPA